MFNQIQRLREERNEGGFTLIELLIVIVILGILAAVVVFAVGGIKDKGTSSACKADLKTVEVAAEAYFAQNGEYAADMAALQTAGLLRQVPNSPDYQIKYTPAENKKSATVETTATGGACPS